MEKWKCKKCGRHICKCRRILGETLCKRCADESGEKQDGIFLLTVAAAKKLLDCCKE